MSSPLRKLYETDKDVEKTGVVLTYGEGIEIRIARAGGANKKFGKVMSKLAKPHHAALKNEALDDDIAEDLLLQGYAKAVVLDWKGVTKDILTKNEEDAEVQLECTPENVVAVFRALPDLFTDIRKMADNISLFRAEIAEAEAKN